MSSAFNCKFMVSEYYLIFTVAPLFPDFYRNTNNNSAKHLFNCFPKCTSKLSPKDHLVNKHDLHD
uniref:Ovule protein n=1 Tax=Heterorhabditis bacteriophora TaxID=37862 RepID=A0A1I7X845_HETBA